MNAQTLMIAAAAGVVGLLLVARARPAAVAPSPTVSGDAKRLAGVSELYAAGTAQSNATDAAIAANWASMEKLFATDPYFYV